MVSPWPLLLPIRPTEAIVLSGIESEELVIPAAEPESLVLVLVLSRFELVVFVAL